MQINSIAQFAEACKTLDSDEIYELFEFNLSEEMRNAIYEIADDADDVAVLEPARLAFNAIGLMYGVESLINY